MKQTFSSATEIDSYEAALQFLDTLDESAMKLGLNRIQLILATLGNPQDRLPMVHIAGTNGKGSVTAMLSAVLKSAGHPVGSFTSPHLIHVRERIAINGNPILPDDFQYEVASLKEHLEQHQIPKEDWPTYFEFLNIVAYRYFERKNVDITVFETGLGGRLDSTNVVKHPNVTVITSIGLDHMMHLGDTLAKIAAEKAGILKTGTPLVLGSNLPSEALTVIQNSANALDIPITYADAQSLQILPDSNPQQGLHIANQQTGQTYRLSLLGPYQCNNLATVLACVQQLRSQGVEISETALQEGLRHSDWPVRFQYFDEYSLILDGSHNADGFESLTESLQLYFAERPFIWLLSLRKNRAPELLVQFLQQFPSTLGVIVTSSEPQELYHSPTQLAEHLRQALGDTFPIEVATTPDAALTRLQTRIQDSQALGIVTGSLYTAGAVLDILNKRAPSDFCSRTP